MNNLVKKYIPMVDFICNFMGNNCEVVLHDFSDKKNSIVRIRNGHISGRKEGDTIEEHPLEVLSSDDYEKENFICNYKVHSKNKKILRSSSYFIKAHNNEILGMLCVNMDVTEFIKARDFLSNMIKFDENIRNIDEDSGNNNIIANMELGAQTGIESMIKNILETYSVGPERMSLDEKIDVVEKLNTKGVFLLKGGVTKVAKMLKVSEATVYRYLSKIK